jgi:hypothetical protein
MVEVLTTTSQPGRTQWANRIQARPISGRNGRLPCWHIRRIRHRDAPLTCSPYWRDGALAQADDGTWPAPADERDAAFSFARSLLADPEVAAPPAWCLDHQQPFVVDNTNPTAAERAVYIAPAKAAGFRVIGYFFQSNVPSSAVPL